MALFEQKSNPFDFGSAGKPIDQTAFNNAIDSYVAQRDKLVNEAIPALDKAIAEVESWAGVVKQIVDIIEAHLPATGTTTPQTEQMLSEVTTQKCAIQQIANQLLGVRQSLPQLGRILNTLLCPGGVCGK